MPLSPKQRPAWDIQKLTELGLHPTVDEQIWQYVWNDEEKVNFASKM